MAMNMASALTHKFNKQRLERIKQEGKISLDIIDTQLNSQDTLTRLEAHLSLLMPEDHEHVRHVHTLKDQYKGVMSNIKRASEEGPGAIADIPVENPANFLESERKRLDMELKKSMETVRKLLNEPPPPKLLR